MELEDETPVVESRGFHSEIEPMMTSMRTMTPTRSCSDNSTEDDNRTQSYEHSVEKGLNFLILTFISN